LVWEFEENKNMWERKEGTERKKIEREKFWKKWVIPPFSSVYGRSDPVWACPSRYRAPSRPQPLIFITWPTTAHIMIKSGLSDSYQTALIGLLRAPPSVFSWSLFWPNWALGLGPKLLITPLPGLLSAPLTILI
jgi:hypothetical protein